MNSSLPSYQYIMQSSVVIIPTYSGYCNKLSSTVVSAFAWHAREPGFDPQLGKIIICIFFISCYMYYLQSFSQELDCNDCLLDNT